MNWIIRLLLNGLAVVLSAYILPGVEIAGGYGTALLVALILALVNVIVKPILVILTIPITILTLGLFLLVINAALILFVDNLVSGFTVDGFWWALAAGAAQASTARRATSPRSSSWGSRRN